MAMTLEKFSEWVKDQSDKNKFEPHPDEAENLTIDGLPVSEGTYYEKLSELVEQEKICFPPVK